MPPAKKKARENFATKSIARGRGKKSVQPQNQGQENFARKSVAKKRKKRVLPKATGSCRHIYKYIGYTVPKLKELCRKRHLKGYSTLNKPGLIQILGEKKRLARKERRRARNAEE